MCDTSILNVGITKHARRRWRQRYGRRDEDDVIDASLTNRARVAVVESLNARRWKTETLLLKLSDESSPLYEQKEKVVIGDLTVVFHRVGLDVSVITVY